MLEKRRDAAESTQEFGYVLRSLRVRSALTQMQLAERAGVSLRAVAALECGERRAPYRETVSALVRALRTSPADAECLKAAALRARQRPKSASRHAPPKGNLPIHVTTFVGRRDCLDSAQNALSSQRCVVLTGRAGVGKTRLALVLAERLAPRFADGAWLIDLSAVRDERGVVKKAATILARANAYVPDPASLVREIGDREMLLVFDNCERVAASCTELIAALRNGCPNLAIVATSIAALELDVRCTVIDPLPLPDHAGAVTMDGLRRFASAELFIDRCERYGYRFEDERGAVSAITSICRRLEGLPLAIELAASRAASLGLAVLDATLERWFSISTGAFVDVPDRHRSLFAAIDWSHELLDEAERIVFRRLSLFAGAFDMAAAEAVCSETRLDRSAIPEIVRSLSNKSLIAAGVTAGVRHWAFFDSIRSYAATKLAAASDREIAARAHARHFANAYADGLKHGNSASSSQWLRAVDAHIDDIEAAISWGSSDGGDPLIAARLIGSLLLYWSRTGRVQAMQTTVDALLPRIDADAEPDAFAGLLLARIADPHGNDAVTTGARAVALYERSGDLFDLAVARISFAHSLMHVGRCEDAVAEIDRAASAADAASESRSTPSTRFAATVRRSRGEAYAKAGRWHEARAEHAAGLDICLALRDDFAARSQTISLAEASFAIGDGADAVVRLESLLHESRSTRDTFIERGIHANLAAYRLVIGETDMAAHHVREALAIEGREPFLLACVLQHAATVLALRGRAIEAARLRGYVDAFRTANDFERGRTEQLSNAVLEGALARQLSHDVLVAHGREGASLAEHAAVGIARAMAG